MPKQSKNKHDYDKVRAYLINRLRSLTTNVSFRELTNGDACDIAFDTAENEMISKLAERGHREAAQIEYALKQLDAGRYGICENCENQIAASRLSTLPYITLCIGCQVMAEDGLVDRDDLRRKWERLDVLKVNNTDTDNNKTPKLPEY